MEPEFRFITALYSCNCRGAAVTKPPTFKTVLHLIITMPRIGAFATMSEVRNGQAAGFQRMTVLIVTAKTPHAHCLFEPIENGCR